MSWATATHAVWLSGCGIALMALWLPPIVTAAQSRPWLRKLQTVYLTAHCLSSGLSLGAAPLGPLTTLLVLLAAATYLVIGTELLGPRRPHWRRRALAVSGCTYAIWAALVVWLDGTSAPMFLVFAYYLVAALYASLGVVAVVNRHRSAIQIWPTFAVAAVFGVVDFLLPAFAYLGADLWEPAFLGRLLDVLFYLPGMVAAMRFLDGLPDEQFVQSSARTTASGGGAGGGGGEPFRGLREGGTGKVDGA